MFFLLKISFLKQNYNKKPTHHHLGSYACLIFLKADEILPAAKGKLYNY